MTVEISSSIVTPLGPQGTTTITAVVFDQTNHGVVWSIAPVNFGTLSPPTSTNEPSSQQTQSSVNYTAPATPGGNTTVMITATSISNPTVSASIPIQVSPTTVTIQAIAPDGTAAQVGYGQTLGPGQQLSIAGVVVPSPPQTQPPVTFSLSPADAGSLANPGSNMVTYVAPSVVSSPFTATVTATSVTNPGVFSNMLITVLPSGGGPNVAAVQVNGGPVPNQFYPNAAFTSVTICNPSTGNPTACQNVDGILVDTGSYGLRILQSQIPLLKLPVLLDGTGNTLENCASLVNGSYLWGPVSRADVYIAADSAQSLPIQVVSSSVNVVVPDGCSNGGVNLNTPQLLGANGILGIGPEPTDCTLAGVNFCDGSTTNPLPNLYYGCPSIGCALTDSPVTVPGGISGNGRQVINPVAFANFSNQLNFGRLDNNGAIFQFPGVAGPESSVTGTLTFGIGTEPNNALGNATIFDLDANDNFTTIFSGQTLTRSFIDTGSNALYFPDSLPICSVNTKYFCPSTLTNLSSETQGATQGHGTVSFSVDNADNLLSATPGDAAFSTLAGPKGTFQSCANGNISCVFDWGMPFFYGRSVAMHIDSCSPPPAVCAAPTAAYWAY